MIPKGPQRVGQRLAELKTGYTVGLRPLRSLSAATGHAFRGADRCCLTAIASAPAGRTPIPRPLGPVPLSLDTRLPRWPLSPTADGPAIVVGEVHHPVRAIESPAPEWLTIPERGLYTGVAIFGAVGSGKTSACMHPVARQLFGWQATNPERRAAALVLEMKGDFCHDIRRMLTELDRGGDYIKLSLDGRLVVIREAPSPAPGTTSKWPPCTHAFDRI